MTSRSHDFDNSMTVLDSNLSMVPLNTSPTLYEELDQNFDGFKGCTLIARHSFDADWPTWEIHPHGDELVCLLEGAADMVLFSETGTETTVRLDQPGAYTLVPRNTWHTARSCAGSTMLFITPGQGTRNVALEDFPE